MVITAGVLLEFKVSLNIIIANDTNYGFVGNKVVFASSGIAIERGSNFTMFVTSSLPAPNPQSPPVIVLTIGLNQKLTVMLVFTTGYVLYHDFLHDWLPS